VKLSASYPVAAPRARVFAALTDPEVLKRCIEGCESFERKDDSTSASRNCRRRYAA
jgi:uncharacterized protein